jgi:hypothetical protein
MPCQGPSTGNLAGLEWVENPDVHLPEIRFVSRGDDQLVNACRRGNHSVLSQLDLSQERRTRNSVELCAFRMDPSGCGVQDHDLRRSFCILPFVRREILGGQEGRTRSPGKDLRNGRAGLCNGRVISYSKARPRNDFQHLHD